MSVVKLNLNAKYESMSGKISMDVIPKFEKVSVPYNKIF